jgi:hypothetical protein
MATAVKARSGIQVTLALANTPYQLSALLAAIDAATSTKFRRMQLQSDPANAGSKIYVGDSALSTSRYGYTLQAGDFGPEYKDGVPSHTTIDLYVMGNAVNLLLNFEGEA